jgi:MFS family permease
LYGMFFASVLFLQRVLGYDAIETGLAFLPVSVGIGLLSLSFAPRLIMRFGARTVLVPSLLLIAVGLVLMTQAPADANFAVDLLPAMLLFGVGAGVTFPALMTLAMSGASPSDAGLASGLVNTSLQVGGAVGLAVLATLSSSRTESLLADGESAASALTGGYHLAFGVAAGILIAAIAIAAVVLQPEKKAQESVAAEPAYSEVS